METARRDPTRLATPTQAVPVQEPALHLLGGIWVGSHPTCGFQLTAEQGIGRQLRPPVTPTDALR